jgi:23S rRNA U2552 (ribose-2'-O)-methylase RlmE/FtsJ
MRHGQPAASGASLRAFRDFLPNAEIIGADIDRTTLFEEERIRTHFVDQTDTSSLAALSRTLDDRPFDLIIDDGLHSPSANIATLTIALKLLKPNGHVVIEDIPESSLPIWYTISALLAPDFQPTVLSARRGHLFVVQKRC